MKTVFALSLEYFKKEAISKISSCSSFDVNPQDVKWVITVPAIWDDGAKQIMREAAYEVRGIIRNLKKYNDLTNFRAALRLEINQKES